MWKWYVVVVVVVVVVARRNVYPSIKTVLNSSHPPELFVGKFKNLKKQSFSIGLRLARS